MNAQPQSASEWLASKHVTETLARQRAEELARPLAERLYERLLDNARHAYVEVGDRKSEQHRALWYDEDEGLYRAHRGPDTDAQRGTRRSFEVWEDAVRWALEP